VATYIIGDVHGCYEELCELLSSIGPTADDRVIFVGDLVVRGPDSASVARLAMNGTIPNQTVILGNNEAKLRPTLGGDPTYATPAVLRTLEQLRSAGILAEALDYFDALPLYLDLDAYAIVHAGVRPGRPLAEQSRGDLLRIKTLDGTPEGPMWYDEYDGPQTVIFGHHVVKDPLFLPFAINIDTGCVYGGKLTALELGTMSVTSVRAKDVYYRIPQKAFLLE
jgi:diadenosine tetraphosphatase ApaH/serine/threonine PP2A family protein phosphatase